MAVKSALKNEQTQAKRNLISSEGVLEIRITPDAGIFRVNRESEQTLAVRNAFVICTDSVLFHLTFVRRTVDCYISTPALINGVDDLTTPPWTVKFWTIKIRSSFES